MDGVYLFNFFTTRQLGAEAWEPPFEVLAQLGSVETLAAAERGLEQLFVATPVTAPGSFTKGARGARLRCGGEHFRCQFRSQTIGRVTPAARASLFLDLPGTGTGNGIRFDRQGQMFVADYAAHDAVRRPENWPRGCSCARTGDEPAE